ncbi:MAG TPA: hypothetical protein PK733_04645 [Clostridiales bacterium]|nr:hypothetical protein [Clostridiales bacterium]
MNELLFGYFDTDITPSISMGLEGYPYRLNHGFENGGVIDRIYACALCLKSGSEALLIITVDLCDLSFETADDIRNAISLKTGLPRRNIMLIATHTHSAPVTICQNVKNKEAIDKIEDYLKELKNKIISISSQACARRYSAKLSISTLKTCLGYNRRYISVDEKGNSNCKMLFNLWQNHGHDTTGEVDSEIPIIMIEKEDDENRDNFLTPTGINRVIIVNAPYHPVVMGENNNYISADYPGAIRKCIENELMDGTKVISITGASGNTQPFISCVNNLRAIRIFGNAIGYGVITALAGRKYIPVDGIQGIEEEFDYNNPETNRIRTQVFRIGNIGIAGISGDCFNELGTFIRANSGIRQILIATHANGRSGYIPTPESFNIGGYEIDIAIKRGYDTDVFEKVVNQVLKNLKTLRE